MSRSTPLDRAFSSSPPAASTVSLAEGSEFLECRIFLAENLPPPALHGALKNFLTDLNRFISSQAGDYFWHHDSLQFFILPRSPPVATLISPVEEPDRLPPHLYARLSFCGHYTDEWFAVYLIYLASLHFSSHFYFQLSDSDGDFLIIESSDFCPPWLSPENSRNRFFLHQGKFYYFSPELQLRLISAPSGREEFEPAPLALALSAISRFPEECRAPEEVQKIIQKRFEGFPQTPLENSRHFQRTFLAWPVFRLLSRDPTLLRRFVPAFECRDLIDQRIANKMENFLLKSGDSPAVFPLVCSRVRFTRTHFAALHFQAAFQFPQRLQQRLPLVSTTGKSEEERRALEFGCKIMAGAEIYYARLKNKMSKALEKEKSGKIPHSQQGKILPVHYRIARLESYLQNPSFFSYLEDNEFYSELSSSEHHYWLKFLEKCFSLDFFHGLQENSSAYREKIAQARKEFIKEIVESLKKKEEKEKSDGQKASEPPVEEEEIFPLRQGLSADEAAELALIEETLAESDNQSIESINEEAASFPSFSSLSPDDEFSWLDDFLSPDRLESFISHREKERELTSGVKIFQAAEEKARREAEQKTPEDSDINRLVSRVNAFVQRLSGLEGAEIPEEQEKRENPRDQQEEEIFDEQEEEFDEDEEESESAEGMPDVSGDVFSSSDDSSFLDLLRLLSQPDLRFEPPAVEDATGTILPESFQSFNAALRRQFAALNGGARLKFDFPDTDDSEEEGEKGKEEADESDDEPTAISTPGEWSQRETVEKAKREFVSDSKAPEAMEDDENENENPSASIADSIAAMESELAKAGFSLPISSSSLFENFAASHAEQRLAGIPAGPASGLAAALGIPAETFQQLQKPNQGQKR